MILPLMYKKDEAPENPRAKVGNLTAQENCSSVSSGNL